MDIPDTATLVKILKLQNESLLSMLWMISMMPDLGSVQYSEVKRIGDDLRKLKAELESI